MAVLVAWAGRALRRWWLGGLVPNPARTMQQAGAVAGLQNPGPTNAVKPETLREISNFAKQIACDVTQQVNI